MNPTDLFLRMLDTTFDEESWFAPLKPAIEGISAAQANWRPAGEAANTIWENVNHLIYYKERLTANLEGREWTQHLDGDETFHLTEPVNNDKEWLAVVERVQSAQIGLREALSKASPEMFEQDFLKEKALDTIIHEAYHTGQIIQIRKLQGSWPTHR